MKDWMLALKSRFLPTFPAFDVRDAQRKALYNNFCTEIGFLSGPLIPDPSRLVFRNGLVAVRIAGHCFGFLVLVKALLNSFLK